MCETDPIAEVETDEPDLPTVEVTVSLTRHQIPLGHPQPYLMYHNADFECPTCKGVHRISSRDRWDLFEKVIIEELAIKCCEHMVRPRLPRVDLAKFGEGNRHTRRAMAKVNGGRRD